MPPIYRIRFVRIAESVIALYGPDGAELTTFKGVSGAHECYRDLVAGFARTGKVVAEWLGLPEPVARRR